MPKSLSVIFSFSALFLGIWLVFIADGLLVSSTAVVLRAHSQLATGLITACMFAGALACAALAPKLIARFGFVRSYAVFSALFALATLAHACTESLAVWGALRVVVGFCYYSIVLVAESWLNARAVSAIRSRVLSFYEIVFYCGFGAGTLIMGLDLAPAWLFLIAAMFVIAGQIPLNLTSLRSPPLPKAPPKALPRVFDLAPLALVTSICAGLLMNGFFTMGSAFALAAGKDAAGASAFIVCGMLGGCAAHTVCGGFSDRFGRKAAILVFDVLAIAAAVVLAAWCVGDAGGEIVGGAGAANSNLTASGAEIAANSNLTASAGNGWFALLGFYGGAGLLGAGICVLYSLALARANDVVKDKSECINVSRTLLFSYLLGSSLAPVLIGAFLGAFGSVGYALFCLLVAAGLFVFALFQRGVSPAEREKFARQGGVSLVFEKEREDG